MGNPNLERASNGNFLWPPVADAVDTYLRRKGAGSYETAWRLIHVWESVGITLAVGALSRLSATDGSREILRRVREHFYGAYWDETTRSTRTVQGAADGSIDQWIAILDEIAKSDGLTGAFLTALRSFLDAETMDLSKLVAAWGRTCDVPADARDSRRYRVRQAMRHVNSLRNRLAHVPFPHDQLDELAASLEDVTQQLFGLDPLPSSHEKEGNSSALTGAFRIQSSFLHGTHRETLEDEGPSSLQFVFPVKRRGEVDSWDAGPFIHLDAMLRPHVLTRVKTLDACEYTRFRAEANAILIKDNVGIERDFPRPRQEDYRKQEDPDGSGGAPAVPTQMGEMDQAIDALHREDYDAAIAILTDLSQRRPGYHVGLLRLGYAEREKAVRVAATNRGDAVELLRSAIGHLENAAKHRDVEYQAQAIYERSKAHYHMVRFNAVGEDSYETALRDARRACYLHGDPKYQTWLEHLDRVTQGKVAMVPDVVRDKARPHAIANGDT